MKLFYSIVIILIISPHHFVLAENKEHSLFELTCIYSLNRMNDKYILETNTDTVNFQWNDNKSEYQIIVPTDDDDKKINFSISTDHDGINRLSNVDYLSHSTNKTNSSNTYESKYPAAELSTHLDFDSKYLLSIKSAYENQVVETQEKIKRQTSEVKRLEKLLNSTNPPSNEAILLWKEHIEKLIKDKQEKLKALKKSLAKNFTDEKLIMVQELQKELIKNTKDLKNFNDYEQNNNHPTITKQVVNHLIAFYKKDILEKKHTGKLSSKSQEKVSQLEKAKFDLESSQERLGHFEKEIAKYQFINKQKRQDYKVKLFVRLLPELSSWVDYGHSLEVSVELYQTYKNGTMIPEEEGLIAFGLGNSDRLFTPSMLKNVAANNTINTMVRVQNPEFYEKLYAHEKLKSFRNKSDISASLKEALSDEEIDPNSSYIKNINSKMEKVNSDIYYQAIVANKHKLISPHAVLDFVVSCKLTTPRLRSLELNHENLMCVDSPENYNIGGQ